MKTIYQSIFGVALLAAGAGLASSCIEETEPTSVATQEQAARSTTATKAQALAMPAQLQSMDENYVDNYSWHAPFGYPAIEIIRDIMTSDMGFPTSSYASHFYRFGACQYLGGDYIYVSYIWNFYYKLVQTANAIIDVIDPEVAASEQLGYLGAAYAYRALAYLDMARMYEFLPNDVTTSINADGNDVSGLTVPIVKNGMTEEEARNNPRAKREEMVEFIREDLANAKEYIVEMQESARLNNTLPNLACVYGLEARLDMWTEDYAAAAEAAQQAITLSKMNPISESAGTDIASGMNVSKLFMWCCNLVKEDDAVQSGIVNFASWMSNQTTYGYTGAATGQYMVCDKNFYDRISNTDWRKLWWQAPEGSVLRDEIKYVTASDKDGLPPYAAIKFRPGQGNSEDYNVGSATAISVMRVEEMYFILAEAQAHLNPTQGVQTLISFMRRYRDAAYNSLASTEAAAVEEIIFQKRVELWGEGQSFFDYKRLNMSVTRGYEGTPFFDQLRLNTNGRPGWMNFVMSVGEYQNNRAVEHWNNPDPSDKYTIWTAPTE